MRGRRDFVLNHPPSTTVNEFNLLTSAPAAEAVGEPSTEDHPRRHGTHQRTYWRPRPPLPKQSVVLPARPTKPEEQSEGNLSLVQQCRLPLALPPAVAKPRPANQPD